jgi:hypothetical protein
MQEFDQKNKQVRDKALFIEENEFVELYGCPTKYCGIKRC